MMVLEIYKTFRNCYCYVFVIVGNDDDKADRYYLILKLVEKFELDTVVE